MSDPDPQSPQAMQPNPNRQWGLGSTEVALEHLTPSSWEVPLVVTSSSVALASLPSDCELPKIRGPANLTQTCHNLGGWRFCSSQPSTARDSAPQDCIPLSHAATATEGVQHLSPGLASWLYNSKWVTYPLRASVSSYKREIIMSLS